MYTYLCIYIYIQFRRRRPEFVCLCMRVYVWNWCVTCAYVLMHASVCLCMCLRIGYVCLSVRGWKVALKSMFLIWNSQLKPQYFPAEFAHLAGAGCLELALLRGDLEECLLSAVRVRLEDRRPGLVRGGEATVDWDTVASNRSTGSFVSNFNTRISSKISKWDIWAQWGFPTISSPLPKSTSCMNLEHKSLIS